jgi:nitrogen fixation protein NifX
MEVKVAVASSDGIHVNAHFGKARRFMIYRLNDGGWEHLEDRENLPACAGQEHGEGLLEQTAAVIADCSGVVVDQIGAAAVDVLISRRVLPFMLFGTIAEALDVLKDSRHFKRTKQ